MDMSVFKIHLLYLLQITMKYHLSFILITLTIICSAQDINSVPKNTTKIIVKNRLSKDENFQMVGVALINNGYRIKTKDKDFYTIETEFSQTKRPDWRVSFMFIISDSAITITGRLFVTSLDRSPDNSSALVNRGMNGSAFKVGFEKMFGFAKLLSYVEFEYEL